MKISLFSIVFFAAIPFCTFAQYHDNTWLFGYQSYEQIRNNGYKRIRFDFGDSLIIRHYQGDFEIAKTYGSVCDSTGFLQVVSNGCYIADSSETEIPGSSGLNPGIHYNTFCAQGSGYNVPNAMIALPETQNENRIHFFHYPLVLQNNWFFYKKLLHTVVEKNKNTGQWEVEFKNKPVVEDTISGFGVQAVKHANGRDWWVVCTKDSDDGIFTVLVTPDTTITRKQDIGLEYTQQLFGELVFSPDGSKLALYEVRKDLQVFDFDRCTGTLSNPVHVPIVDLDSIQFFSGLAWSADGRFIYCATVRRLYQFDTQAPDLAGSKVLVAVRNPGGCPDDPSNAPLDLATLESTPDGRILSRGLGGFACFTVIEHPERQGEQCEVNQGGLFIGVGPTPFDAWATSSIPNFPNFRLGPIDGSDCDTLGLDNHPLANWRYSPAGTNEIDFTSVSWYEPTEWWWNFGDPASGTLNESTEKHPTHAFSAPGKYEVCLTVSNANGSDTKCKNVWISTSSVSAPGVGQVLRLYPNPTSGVVQVSHTEGQVTGVVVYNALGHRVWSTPVKGGQFDLSGLPAGYYVVHLLSEEGVFGVERVVLVR